MIIDLLHDWVLLSPIEPETERKTAAGLIMPSNADARELPKAEVVASGPGTYDYNGNLHPTNVTVGDIVLYMRNGLEHDYMGKNYYLVHATSIVGKVE